MSAAVNPAWGRVAAPKLLTPLATLVVHGRQSIGISQSELARRVGCDHSFMSKIESGARLPGVRTMVVLAALLPISLTELLDAYLDSTDEAVSHD